MKTCFINNQSDELIVFLCGWGMDEKPLLPLACKSDVLYIYNYSSNELIVNIDYTKYKKKSLIAFSCGVYIAPLIQDKLPNFDIKIAINGTMNFSDNSFGLSKTMIEFLQNLSKKNYLQFRKDYFVNNKEHLRLLIKNQSTRTLDSAHKELDFLLNLYKKNGEQHYKYDKILISKYDKILPMKTQINYWRNQYIFIDGGHFPFYNFKSFEEILSI